MSIPRNPLNQSGSSTHRHILVAFKYAEDAFNAKEFNPSTAGVGETIESLDSKNIVVVNEFSDQRFSIPEAIWDFDFAPSVGTNTSTSVGKIVVVDRFVPYNFLGFLQYKILNYLNQGTNLMSLSHATFMLKTIFTTDETSVVGTEKEPEPIIVNPFFFNIDSIESVPAAGEITPHSHVLHVMGASNTTGLMRSFSSLYQMDITHKDGNIHSNIPKADGGAGTLRFRDQEDQSNNINRKNRMDLSKPMITLGDIFGGLEADLNQLKYAHTGQLQEWLGEVNDSFLHKIKVAPEQQKKPTPKQLPLSYKIDLDPLYKNYQIDNRNMPFEQPEERQGTKGIRVFPVRAGAHILDIITDIMMLSQQIGIDALTPNPKTFKVTITATRTKNDNVGYVINIKIRQYIFPCNGIIHKKDLNGADTSDDTGPGKAGDNALFFYVNDPLDADVDVISFKSHLNYDTHETMLEQQEDREGTGIVYGDREQATVERDIDVPFFQTLYSGVRAMVAPYTINGLENAQHAGDFFNLVGRYTYDKQTTMYELVIIGNPHLLSDVNRNPKDVVNDNKGVVNYYPKPEVDPMYIKLKIFERSMVDSSPEEAEGLENKEVQDKFYYDGYYHMHRVVNMFGQIGPARSFYQSLILKRGDTLV